MYTTGYVSETGEGLNILIAKYDSSLVLQTSITFNGTGAGTDAGFGISLADSGNVYAAGVMNETVGGDNVWVGKFDSSLVLQTSVSVDGSANSDDQGRSIACSDADTVHVTGYLEHATQDTNIWMAKYDSSLVMQSSIAVNSATDGTDIGYDIKSDDSGNIYLSGQLDNASGTPDIWLAKISMVEPGMIAAAAGGTLTYDLPGGRASVVVPAGAFSGIIEMTIQPPTGAVPAAPAGMTATGITLDISVTGGAQPVRALNITLPYRDSDITGMNESRLIIARYAADATNWVPLYSTPAPGSNKVSAITGHLSLFQIMQAVPAESVKNVRTFPNPFRPNQGHTMVTILDVPAQARIRIYTMAGELIRDMTAGGAGVASWDGRNQAGMIVAPGIYYGYAQSGTKNRRTFKIAVER